MLTQRDADKSLARPDWKNDWKVAIFRPTRRSLLLRRPGWTDNFSNFFFFWMAGKSQFGRCSLFPSWSGLWLISTPVHSLLMVQTDRNYFVPNSLLAHNKYTRDWWPSLLNINKPKCFPSPPHPLSICPQFNPFPVHKYWDSPIALYDVITAYCHSLYNSTTHHSFCHSKLQKTCILETASLKQSIPLPESRKRLKAKFLSFKWTWKGKGVVQKIR